MLCTQTYVLSMYIYTRTYVNALIWICACSYLCMCGCLRATRKCTWQLLQLRAIIVVIFYLLIFITHIYIYIYIYMIILRFCLILYVLPYQVDNRDVFTNCFDCTIIEIVIPFNNIKKKREKLKRKKKTNQLNSCLLCFQ